MVRRLGFALLLVVATACGGADGSASTASTEEGGALYLRTCGGCHGAKGTPQQEASLPGLDAYSAEELELRILHGGEQMPTFAAALTDAELDAIVGYLLEG